MIPMTLQYKQFGQQIRNKNHPQLPKFTKKMRGFMILCLTAALTAAAPQGYNYHRGVAGISTGNGFGSGVQHGVGFNGNVGGQVHHGLDFNNGITSSSFLHNSGVSINDGPSSNPHGFQQVNQVATGTTVGHNQLVQQHPLQLQHQQHQQQHQQHHQHQHHQQQQHSTLQTIVSKRFFIHTAPKDHDDDDDDYKEKHITVGVPRKNYNIVFIKAPARLNKKTTLKISPAVNEDKTIIYVLNKKTDASDVHAEVLEQPTATTKPEVFFIKYKTNEEAAHAQEQIQAQYDALGGSSQISDEGVASVSSVIGSLGGATNGASTGAGLGSGSAADAGAGAVAGAGDTTHSHGNGYLPPNFS